MGGVSGPREMWVVIETIIRDGQDLSPNTLTTDYGIPFGFCCLCGVVQ